MNRTSRPGESNGIPSDGGEFWLTFALEVDADRLAGNPMNVEGPKK
jgi:hypothetical protein